MARCPFAEFRGPIPNETPGGMGSPVVGVVFHIMGSSFSAADAWFHDSNAKASAHFGIKQDGSLVQWVDTADKAWHAVAANSHWIGVETEGVSGPLSEAGCQTFGRLYAWLQNLYGFPFAITDDPVNGHGFGWHGMGGSAWGGHDYCPGPERRAQRAYILKLAQGQAPTPATVPVAALEESMFTVPPDTKAYDFPVPSWAKKLKALSNGTKAKVALGDGKAWPKVHNPDWWGPNLGFTMDVSPAGIQVVEVVNWGSGQEGSGSADLNLIFDVA